MYKDCRDIALSTQLRTSADRYDQAVELTACYRTDPLALIEKALDDDPDFVSGHCLRAALGVMGAERAAEPLIRESVAAGVRLAAHANERELSHLRAARAWLEGDFHRASSLYGQIVLDHPRDLLALQVSHLIDFYLGQQRLLRDRVAQVLGAWDLQTPGYGYVLGMLAFGLEETSMFARARATGTQALELNRQDAWAVHAVTHVFEMTGQSSAGASWLEARRPDFAPQSSFAFHNFWHLALFELAKGDVAAALRLYDEQIWPAGSRVALELVDAAALLWRLYLRGVDVGGRAVLLAETWRDPSYRGYYCFNDAHAVMALVAAGNLSEARVVVSDLEQRVAEHDSNARLTREVGLPLARALVAFGEQRFAETIEILLPVRQQAHRFGGSNAQRDLLDLTLLEASRRSGRRTLLVALESERALLRQP